MYGAHDALYQFINCGLMFTIEFLCVHTVEKEERPKITQEMRKKSEQIIVLCLLCISFAFFDSWLFSYTFKNENSRLMIFSNSLGTPRIETTFCECLLYIFTYILPLYNQLMFFFISVSLLNIARILLIL